MHVFIRVDIIVHYSSIVVAVNSLQEAGASNVGLIADDSMMQQ